MNVFYADDDADDLELFCMVLQQINPTIRVVLAKDGQEALKTLKTQTPDFIFLDLNMPKMNGIECLIKIKLDSRLKSIPVIIHSTTSDKNEIKKLMMLGAEDFITKACTFNELRKAIQKVLTKEYLVLV